MLIELFLLLQCEIATMIIRQLQIDFSSFLVKNRECIFIYYHLRERQNFGSSL
jgi:hypothetical protein